MNMPADARGVVPRHDGIESIIACDIRRQCRAEAVSIEIVLARVVRVPHLQGRLRNGFAPAVPNPSGDGERQPRVAGGAKVGRVRRALLVKQPELVVKQCESSGVPPLPQINRDGNYRAHGSTESPLRYSVPKAKPMPIVVLGRESEGKVTVVV